MEITLEDIKLAQSGEGDKWVIGNEVLYQMCQKYPNHTDESEIIAKVWLIGRSYAAAVERRRQKDQDSLVRGDLFYEQCVAPALKEHELDNRMDTVKQYASIEEGAIVPILELHNYLLMKLEAITHDCKRSLASKYLHFHLPSLFFIYDRIAYSVLNKLLPHHKTSRKVQENYDVEYQPFFLKMLDLRDKIQREHQCVLGPRELDRLLRNLWYKYAKDEKR